MAKIQCNVISYTLKRTVDITVVLPSVTIPESLSGECHHDYTHKLPVLYLFHGFGNNNQQWTGYTNVELYAEERQIAVVMIAGENKFYLDQGTDKFDEFIEHELPEFILATFPISPRKEDTYVAGLSMGGFGAIYHGLSHPERYAAIGGFSAGLKLDGRPDCGKLAEKLVEEKKDIPAIFLAIGEDDFLFEKNVSFHQTLEKLNIPHTWITRPNYAHEWRFWDLEVEEFLDWIVRTDYYAGKKRKV